MPSPLELASEYYFAGGYVMPPLMVSAALLWYGLGYRYSTIKNSTSRYSVRDQIERDTTAKKENPKGIIEQAIATAWTLKKQNPDNLRAHLDGEFSKYTVVLGRHLILVRTLVAITPLLGLLGTVAGMVETFDALQTMALFTQSGGIAGGISQALISTQLGLAIAIPGLLVSRYLEKRQQRIQSELTQVKDIFCSMPTDNLEPGNALS